MAWTFVSVAESPYGIPSFPIASIKVLAQLIRFPNMAGRKAKRSASVKGTPWMSLNCLRTVDLPDSPAPRSRIFMELSASRASVRIWRSMAALRCLPSTSSGVLKQAPMGKEEGNGILNG